MTTLLYQLRAELWKLFARRRTWLGFGVFIVLQIVIYSVMHFMGGEGRIRQSIVQRGRADDYFFSWMTVGLFVTAASVLLLGGLFIALVSGDIVAKEAEDGHMRMLLTRPISRLRLLALKFFCCFAYTWVLMQFAALAGMALGLAVRGTGGGLFAAFELERIITFFDGDEGINRFFIGSAIMGLCLSIVAALGFFLSCFNIKPAAATIGALSYLLLDSIVRQLNIIENHEYFLITHHLTVWTKVFLPEIPWAKVIRGLAVIFALDATLFSLGAAVFHSRDIKS